MLAGAAAGISAIFRAPLTGAIMGVESPYKHDLAHESLIHALVAAATSYATFAFFRLCTRMCPGSSKLRIQRKVQASICGMALYKPSYIANIRKAEHLHPWFKKNGLAAEKCETAVAFPALQASNKDELAARGISQIFLPRHVTSEML